MKPKIALVKNIRELQGAFEALENADHGVERMGLVYGHTGFGKTTAIAWLMCRTNAIVVKASPTWSKHSMLSRIMTEMGEAPCRRASDMEDAIVAHMKSHGRPLIIDEVDAFTDPQSRCDDGYAMLETLRSIYDNSRRPVILVGMSGVEKYLAGRKQLMRRVYQSVQFQPLDFEDTRTIAKTVCEVEVADELLAKLLEDSKGGVGLITVGLARIERLAKANGFPKVTAEHWGERTFNLQGDTQRGRRHPED